MRTWVVGWWSEVFRILGYLSLFSLIRLAGKGRSAGFVEIWVVLHSVAAAASLFGMAAHLGRPPGLFAYVLVIYASARIFEIVVYQINVLLFDEYRARAAQTPYALHGYRRILVLLVHNYFEIVCWFGAVYTFYYRLGGLDVGPGQPDPTVVSVFRDSLLLMFSFNSERYTPAGDVGLAVFTVHATVGIFMTIVVFARFLALLPAPQSRDPLETSHQPNPTPSGSTTESAFPAPSLREGGTSAAPRQKKERSRGQ
jgi:hypothetical protein